MVSERRSMLIPLYYRDLSLQVLVPRALWGCRLQNRWMLLSWSFAIQDCDHSHVWCGLTFFYLSFLPKGSVTGSYDCFGGYGLWCLFGLWHCYLLSAVRALYSWKFSSMDFRLAPGCAIKSLGEFKVTMVMGLCCGESDTRLITSTVSELFHDSRSVLIRDDFLLGCCCLRLACSNFVSANAASFDFKSNCDCFWIFIRLFAFSFLYGLFVFALLGAFFCFVLLLAFDGPGCSLSRVFLLGFGPVSCWAASFCRSSFPRGICSSIHNFLSFFLLLLYSLTVFHATSSINRGIVSVAIGGTVSVAIAISLLRTTVSFLAGLSIVMVCGI